MKNKKRTLLWSIDGDKLPGTSYLFGAMHVQDERMFGFVERALEKIRLCTAFAAELHLDDSKSSSAALSLQPAKVPPLRELISPKKFRRLHKILLKTTGFDLDHLDGASPFAIVNLLTAQAFQSDLPVTMDEYLWNHAREEGKDMLGIETLEEQIEVLSKIPLQHQVKMLLDMGKDIGDFRRNLLQVTSLYQKGDVQRLYKNVKKSSKGLRRLLLYNRNEIMAERIAGHIAERTLFTAVGAGHLGGEKGVLCLLKLKGFRVQPVR